MKTESNKNINSLKLGSIELSLKDIEENKGFVELNDYYQSAYNFIRDWLSGKNEFDITTSGSTGMPKEITLTREQMVASALGTAEALDLSAFYHALVCINTHYIGGMMMIVRCLEVGMSMTIIEPVANPLEGFTGKERFDFTAVVPLQLESMLKSRREESSLFDQFKCIIVGGAQVSSQLISAISEVSVPIYATYGMTETVSHIALQRLNGKEASKYFTCLENVSIRQDDRGCLLIKSPVTNDEWIATNDMVEIVGERQFCFLGRFDNVINTGGIKVHSERVEAEVEKGLHQFGLSRRLFVYGISDKKLGQKVCLFIEGEEFEEDVRSKLMAELKKSLPQYHAPKEIVFVSRFLETATGKVDKRKIVAEVTL